MSKAPFHRQVIEHLREFGEELPGGQAIERGAGLIEHGVEQGAGLIEQRVEHGVDLVARRVGGAARLRVVVLLASVLALSSADTGAISAIAPKLETSLHIGNVEIGLLVTVSGLTAAAGMLPVGWVTDRWKRTHMVTAAVVLWGAAEVLSAISPTYIFLLIVRLALGALTAVTGPTLASLTGDLFPAKERSEIYGYILTGELLGAGFGLLVAGLFSAWFTWRVALGVLAIPSFVLAWEFHKRLPEPARGGQSRLARGAEHILAAEEVAANGPATGGEPGGTAPGTPHGAGTSAAHRAGDAASTTSAATAGQRSATAGTGSATAGTGSATAGTGSAARAGAEAGAGAGAEAGATGNGSGEAPGPRPEREQTEVLRQVRRRRIDPRQGVVLDQDPMKLGWWESFRYVIAVHSNVTLILASALGYFFFGGVETFALIYIEGYYDVGQAYATLIALAVGAAAVVGAVAGGRVTDYLVARGRLAARLSVPAAAFVIAGAVFVPAIISKSLIISIPLFLVAGFCIAAPNPGLDAARLDIMPSRMWGRAEAVRSFLRSLLQSFAPLIFGFVSTFFGGSHVGFGISGSGLHGRSAAATGLQPTFLIMLVTLCAAAVIVWAGRRPYPGDVAAAAETERRFPPDGAAAPTARSTTARAATRD